MTLKASLAVCAKMMLEPESKMKIIEKEKFKQIYTDIKPEQH